MDSFSPQIKSYCSKISLKFYDWYNGRNTNKDGICKNPIQKKYIKKTLSFKNEGLQHKKNK